ncbi:S8 family serine peptidase, partial [Candidatus Marinimicrobia bacterium]|nr:S8 family serine peptidase [Candidatus Neomarinimicrobiota bacterium]
MNINILKKTVIILSLLLGGSSFIFASNASQSTFLFCLKHDIEPLTISKENNILNVNNQKIQKYIEDYNLQNIEPWLTGANENDYDGEIYLNRIYRVYIGEERSDVNFLISQFDLEEQTVYAEPEYLRKPLYTPNDPAFNQQCSLPAVKAPSAWDFWDIPNVMPGSGREILLASVDTGVDYTHPDLVANIWVNQGEIPLFLLSDVELFSLIDSDGDGKLSSLELISEIFLSDINEDGEVNLKDALASGSPYIDGVDNDGNGYADDLIGWDSSGEWGTADRDPFPKTEGVANNSTWAHGSHVAGILAATTDNGTGMASNVFNGKIMSVKTSKDGPSTAEPGIWNGYGGILYSAKAGFYADNITIINNSWGGGGFSSSEQATINTAHNTYGAIVVAAAGNGDDGGDEEYASHYPSSYDNVISVCAIQCSGSWGGWATFHPTVDLASPGEGIYSAIIGNGYESWMGSSMASPNAASCIGLLQSFYPEMDNDQLIERILSTADRFIYDRNPEYETCNGYSGTDCLGAGMVDVYEAIGIDIAPNIILDNITLIENGSVGDGDNIINPGEAFTINLDLKNEDGWQPATNIGATLMTDYSGVNIANNSGSCASLLSGESCLINYEIILSADIALGDIDFYLETTADGPNSFAFNATLDFNINISLNQPGFPADVSGELISSAAIIDLDNDGQDEIISSDKAGFIHVFEMDGSEWLDGIYPYETGDQNWGSPAVGNLDGDGFDDVVISSKNGRIYIFDHSGLKLNFPSGGYVTATPALGDVDGDGLDEIVFGQYGSPKLLYAINGDGTIV